jgi:hypothetical protein
MNTSAAIAVFEHRIPCGLFLRARIMLRGLNPASAVTMHLDAVAAVRLAVAAYLRSR